MEARGEIAVVADGDGPVWVEGFGAAKRAAAGPETQNAFLIKITGDVSEGEAK